MPRVSRLPTPSVPYRPAYAGLFVSSAPIAHDKLSFQKGSGTISIYHALHSSLMCISGDAHPKAVNGVIDHLHGTFDGFSVVGGVISALTAPISDPIFLASVPLESIPATCQAASLKTSIVFALHSPADRKAWFLTPTLDDIYANHEAKNGFFYRGYAFANVISLTSERNRSPSKFYDPILSRVYELINHAIPSRVERAKEVDRNWQSAFIGQSPFGFNLVADQAERLANWLQEYSNTGSQRF